MGGGTVALPASGCRWCRTEKCSAFECLLKQSVC